MIKIGKYWVLFIFLFPTLGFAPVSHVTIDTLTSPDSKGLIIIDHQAPARDYTITVTKKDHAHKLIFFNGSLDKLSPNTIAISYPFGNGKYSVSVKSNRLTNGDVSNFLVQVNDRKNEQYLLNTPLIQSRNPAIVSLAKSLTRGASSLLERSMRIHDWVASHVSYGLLEVPGAFYPEAAINVLHYKMAICAGYANLSVALHRAAGIPARVIAGMGILSNGTREAHVWTQVYIDSSWVDEDPTWDSGRIDRKTYKFVPFKQPSHVYFDMNSADFNKTHIDGEVVQPDSLL